MPKQSSRQECINTTFYGAPLRSRGKNDRREPAPTPWSTNLWEKNYNISYFKELDQFWERTDSSPLVGEEPGRRIIIARGVSQSTSTLIIWQGITLRLWLGLIDDTSYRTRTKMFLEYSVPSVSPDNATAPKVINPEAAALWAHSRAHSLQYWLSKVVLAASNCWKSERLCCVDSWWSQNVFVRARLLVVSHWRDHRVYIL